MVHISRFPLMIAGFSSFHKDEKDCKHKYASVFTYLLQIIVKQLKPPATCLQKTMVWTCVGYQVRVPKLQNVGLMRMIRQVEANMRKWDCPYEKMGLPLRPSSRSNVPKAKPPKKNNTNIAQLRSICHFSVAISL